MPHISDGLLTTPINKPKGIKRRLVREFETSINEIRDLVDLTDHDKEYQTSFDAERLRLILDALDKKIPGLNFKIFFCGLSMPDPLIPFLKETVTSKTKHFHIIYSFHSLSYDNFRISRPHKLGIYLERNDDNTFNAFIFDSAARVSTIARAWHLLTQYLTVRQIYIFDRRLQKAGLGCDTFVLDVLVQIAQLENEGVHLFPALGKAQSRRPPSQPNADPYQIRFSEFLKSIVEKEKALYYDKKKTIKVNIEELYVVVFNKFLTSDTLNTEQKTEIKKTLTPILDFSCFVDLHNLPQELSFLLRNTQYIKDDDLAQIPQRTLRAEAVPPSLFFSENTTAKLSLQGYLKLHIRDALSQEGKKIKINDSIFPLALEFLQLGLEHTRSLPESEVLRISSPRLYQAKNLVGTCKWAVPAVLAIVVVFVVWQILKPFLQGDFQPPSHLQPQ